MGKKLMGERFNVLALSVENTLQIVTATRLMLPNPKHKSAVAFPY